MISSNDMDDNVVQYSSIGNTPTAPCSKGHFEQFIDKVEPIHSQMGPGSLTELWTWCRGGIGISCCLGDTISLCTIGGDT